MREAFRSVRLQTVAWKILNYGESIPLCIEWPLWLMTTHTTPWRALAAPGSARN